MTGVTGVSTFVPIRPYNELWVDVPYSLLGGVSGGTAMASLALATLYVLVR